MKYYYNVMEYIHNYIVCSFLNVYKRIWFGTFPYYWVLLPISWLYGFITFIIRFCYSYGLFKIYHFPLSIVVIGNLTVGGNGKTPMVLWLVKQLKCRGWFVGVVSRGYGGDSKYYPIILNKNTCSTECGDEPLLIWQRTAVPVAVSPSRSDAVSALLALYPSLDIIISDDGLQHYALARDIEWVIINSECSFGNGWWLPAGPMRERINRLNSVQQIIFHGDNISNKEISMKLIPVAIVNLLTNERRSFNFFSSLIAMAGIAHPSQFFCTLRSCGIFLIKEISFSDHQIYSEKILRNLVQKNEILLMTEKDAVKCRAFAHENWWYLEVEVELIYDKIKLLEPIEENILKHKKIHYNLLS